MSDTPPSPFLPQSGPAPAPSAPPPKRSAAMRFLAIVLIFVLLAAGFFALAFSFSWWPFTN